MIKLFDIWRYFVLAIFIKRKKMLGGRGQEIQQTKLEL